MYVIGHDYGGMEVDGSAVVMETVLED